jgi:hypothetical protein
MPVIPALGRLRQEDQEFKASLCYIVSLCFKKKRKKKRKNLVMSYRVPVDDISLHPLVDPHQGRPVWTLLCSHLGGECFDSLVGRKT